MNLSKFISRPLKTSVKRSKQTLSLARFKHYILEKSLTREGMKANLRRSNGKRRLSGSEVKSLKKISLKIPIKRNYRFPGTLFNLKLVLSRQAWVLLNKTTSKGLKPNLINLWLKKKNFRPNLRISFATKTCVRST